MGKSSTPATPDYEAAARETAAGNLEMAQYATEANRANQNTPWGNLTWTNDRTFDQAGYDAAMAAYNQGLASPQPQTPQFQDAGGGWYTGPNGIPQYDGLSASERGSGGMAPGPGAGTAPNRDDFYTGGNRWTQDITLSPEMQALFDQEMALQQGMFGSQNAALGRVNAALDQPFDMSGLPQGGTALDLSQLSGSPQALNMSQLPGMGSAYNPERFGIDLNALPGAGTAYNPERFGVDLGSLPGMGSALDTSRLGGMPSAFQASGQQLATYDPNLQTNNATELLLRQMNPELDRNREQLRSQLAAQGITQGSEAYNRALRGFENSRTDAYRDAALQGIGLGMQQQGLQFNQGLANRNLLSSEQAQQYGQQMGIRQQGMGEQSMQFDQQQALRHGEAGLRSQDAMLGMQQQGQQFGQQNALRQQEAGLQGQNVQLGMGQQAQQFGQQQNLQQLAAALQQQQYNQQQGNRQMDAALQNQQFGQSEQARQRALAEAAYQRGLPLNELNALRTGNQVAMPQFPGYGQQATTGGPDLLGAAQGQYQADLAAANASNEAGSGLFGGMMQLGGLGLRAYQAGMFSDRRLKRNIRRVGKADNGLGIYAYQYIWGGPEQIGYMADEVLERFPHAVGTRDGFLTVDYGAL